MKGLYLIILLLSVLNTAIAQGIEVFDESQGTRDRVSPVSPYLMTGRIQDNVFAGLAFGTGFYLGNDDGKGSEGGRAGLAWEISAGKWFTPFAGLRLQFSSMKARGHSAGRTPFTTGEVDASGYYRKRFNTSNYRGDLLINARNLFEGYSNSRVWNYIPFAGVGIGRAHGNSTTVREFNMNAGILNTFRISDRVDGTFELRYMAVNSRFDGIPGKGLDGSLILGFGFQFNFGRKGFNRPIQLL